MILQYGNYRHAFNTVGLIINHEIEESETGLPTRVTTNLSLEGKLRNTHPSADPHALDDKIAEMERAYSLPALGDFGLLHDDGRRTAHFWENSNTIGGIRPKLVAWPRYQGGEYCTYRSFNISLTLTQQPRYQPPYTKFNEQITIEGGGQLFGVKPINYGVGTRHRLRTHNPCKATQQGTAVGRGPFYPLVPPPIWPQWLVSTQPRISRQTRPRGSLLTDNLSLEEMEVSWTWEFEAFDRLDGTPHYSLY